MTRPVLSRNHTLAVAAILGAAVGIGVFAFERTIQFMLEHVRAAPTGVMIAAPASG